MKTISQIIAFMILSFDQISAQVNTVSTVVKTEDGVSSLQWVTPKEVNSSYFLIESSADLKDFSIVAKVKAAGYSLASRHYEFEIAGAGSGLNYRVTLVGMDGERSRSLAVVDGLSYGPLVTK